MPMKFLVIDDHPIVRHGMAAALRLFDAPAEIFQAADGAQGLELLAQHDDMDAALIDLEMGVMPGIPTIRQCKLINPTLPVLVVSASESPDDVRKAFAAGANGYCPKSAGLVTMRSALRVVLDGHRYMPAFMQRCDVDLTRAD